MADDKKKGKVFHSTPMPKRQAPRSAVPQMPSSFDDTVGSAIFDQERSWLRAEKDKDSPTHVVIKLGMALPSIVEGSIPGPLKHWMICNPDGVEGRQALEWIIRAAEAADSYGKLLHGRFEGDHESVLMPKPLSNRIDASVLDGFAQGISLSADISEKPVIAELTVHFRHISGLCDERPLSVKGAAVLNWIFRILSLMLEVTAEATRGDLGS